MNYLINTFSNPMVLSSIIFVLVYWFQLTDDIKYSKKRKNLYDKIKLPLLISIIVLLFEQLFTGKIKLFDKQINVKSNQEIYIDPMSIYN